MDQVTIYGRLSCGFCVRAAQLCEAKGMDFQFINIIEEGISKADLADMIGKPVLTVPQILVGDQHIGGYQEFSQYLREQEAIAAR